MAARAGPVGVSVFWTANIAHPEGTITGVANNTAETSVKWVELLKEIVPTLSRLAVLADPSDPGINKLLLPSVQRAAQTLQLQLTSYDLRDLDQLSAVLSTVKADGADGLVVAGGVLGGGANPRIGAEVLKARLPAAAGTRAFAVNGGLLAHGTNNDALARRSASYVDKLLKGAKPGDLPIELPTAFDFVINLKTAQALGLTIPPSVLQQATETIQ